VKGKPSQAGEVWTLKGRSGDLKKKRVYSSNYEDWDDRKNGGGVLRGTGMGKGGVLNGKEKIGFLGPRGVSRG